MTLITTTIIALLAVGFTIIVIAAKLESMETAKKNPLVNKLYWLGARTLQVTFFIAFVLISVLVTSCGSEIAPPGTEEQGVLSHYECRTDCNCDLGYCNSAEPIEGRWNIKDIWELYSENEKPVEVDYPHYENNNLVKVEGSVSVVSHHKESLTFFWQYFGTINVRLKYSYGDDEEIFTYSYWYEGLCEPSNYCAMEFYESPKMEKKVGATLYIFEDLRHVTMNLMNVKGNRVKESFTVLVLEYEDDVGECPEELPVHCYRSEKCVDLMADCVNSAEECADLGGKSFSFNKPEHWQEACNPI